MCYHVVSVHNACSGVDGHVLVHVPCPVYYLNKDLLLGCSLCEVVMATKKETNARLCMCVCMCVCVCV